MTICVNNEIDNIDVEDVKFGREIIRIQGSPGPRTVHWNDLFERVSRLPAFDIVALIR